MTEIAIRPDTGAQTNIRILTENRLPVQSTEATSVSRAELAVVGNDHERNASTFIIKEYPDEASRTIHVDHYRFLQKHGFPLPATVRTIGETRLLVSDLTEQGNRLLFTMDSDGIFRDTHLRNRIEIRHQLREIATKADALGIRMSADAFFLTVDADGTGTVVIGDFGRGVRITPEELDQERQYHDTAEAAAGFWNIIDSRFTEGGYFAVDGPLYPEAQAPEDIPRAGNPETE